MADPTTAPLVDHPTAAPSRKVTAATVSGVIAAVILGIINRHVDLGALVAPFGLTAADLLTGGTALVAGAGGYLARERARPQ